MLKVYYLRQLKDENTEYTEGSEFISRAICDTTEDPNIRRVVIEENPNLESLALKVEEPTKQDLANHKSLPKPSPPARDLAKEIDRLKTRMADIDELRTRVSKLERPTIR